MDRVVGCPVRSCEVRCGGVEVEVAVWRGVCRIRGVHERAYLLTCVRTDAMVGHVACDELLHLNMEKTL